MTNGMLWIRFTSSWAWRNSFFRFFCSSLIYSSWTSRNSSSCCSFWKHRAKGCLQALPHQRGGRRGQNAMRGPLQYAGSGLGIRLNTPCSGCTGPPGPQALAPERTGQSGAETQKVLGSHPVNEKGNLALEAENHLMKSAGAVFPFRRRLTLPLAPDIIQFLEINTGTARCPVQVSHIRPLKLFMSTSPPIGYYNALARMQVLQLHTRSQHPGPLKRF